VANYNENRATHRENGQRSRWLGDERAGVTLAEYFVRRGDEAALRREVEVLPRTALWLAGMLKDQGRMADALEVLTALEANRGTDERHRDEARGMARRWAVR
jgi:hypothetical protein